MAYGYIYKIKNQITGQIYIGQTTQNISVRFKQHDYQSRYESKRYSYLHKSINKYGIANFTTKLLCKADNQQELNLREAFCIRLFNSYAPTNYNIRSSFSGRGSLSSETKLKLSKAHQGKIRGPHKAETKEKISRSNIGQKRSDDCRKNIRESLLGKPNFSCRKEIKLKKGSVELVFSAVFLAANYLGVLRTTVSNALNGYQKPFVKGWEVSHR